MFNLRELNKETLLNYFKDAALIGGGVGLVAKAASLLVNNNASKTTKRKKARFKLKVNTKDLYVEEMQEGEAAFEAFKVVIKGHTPSPAPDGTKPTAYSKRGPFHLDEPGIAACNQLRDLWESKNKSTLHAWEQIMGTAISVNEVGAVAHKLMLQSELSNEEVESVAKCMLAMHESQARFLNSLD